MNFSKKRCHRENLHWKRWKRAGLRASYYFHWELSDFGGREKGNNCSLTRFEAPIPRIFLALSFFLRVRVWRIANWGKGWLTTVQTLVCLCWPRRPHGGPIGIFLLANFFFFTRLFSAVSSFLNRSSGRGGKNKKEIRKYIISSIINIYIYISVQRCIQICCICSKQTNAIISSIRPCVNITIIETFEISREKFISQFFFFFVVDNTWNIHFEENRTVLIGNNFQK